MVRKPRRSGAKNHGNCLHTQEVNAGLSAVASAKCGRPITSQRSSARPPGRAEFCRLRISDRGEFVVVSLKQFVMTIHAGADILRHARNEVSANPRRAAKRNCFKGYYQRSGPENRRIKANGSENV